MPWKVTRIVAKKSLLETRRLPRRPVRITPPGKARHCPATIKSPAPSGSRSCQPRSTTPTATAPSSNSVTCVSITASQTQPLISPFRQESRWFDRPARKWGSDRPASFVRLLPFGTLPLKEINHPGKAIHQTNGWLFLLPAGMISTGIEGYEKMMMNFKPFPKVSLGFFPTPLVDLPRLSKVLGGPKIFMKRDDQTGLALGGNKTRKLEYLLGDAIKQGSNAIIT